MTTTVEALRTIYTALGGSADDVAALNTIPDVLVSIAGQIEANAEAAAAAAAAATPDAGSGGAT